MKDNYNVIQYDKSITEAKERIKQIYEQIEEQKKKREFLDQLSISETNSQHRSQQSGNSKQSKGSVKPDFKSEIESDFLYEQFFEIQDFMKQKSQEASLDQKIQQKSAKKSEQQKTLYIEAKRYKQNPYQPFRRRKSIKWQDKNSSFMAEPKQVDKKQQHQKIDLNQTKKKNYRIFKDIQSEVKFIKPQKKSQQLYFNPICDRISQKYHKIFEQRHTEIAKLQIQNNHPNIIGYNPLKIQLGELQTQIIPYYEKRHSMCLGIAKKSSLEYQNMMKKIKKQQRKCNGLKSRIRDISIYQRIISEY